MIFDEDKEEEKDSDPKRKKPTASQATTDEEPKEKDKPSFLEALRILLNPDYHLVDAFPTLCKVYAIAVAIPIKPAHVRLCLKKNLKHCYL